MRGPVVDVLLLKDLTADVVVSKALEDPRDNVPRKIDFHFRRRILCHKIAVKDSCLHTGVELSCLLTRLLLHREHFVASLAGEDLK